MRFQLTAILLVAAAAAGLAAPAVEARDASYCEKHGLALCRYAEKLGVTEDCSKRYIDAMKK